MQGIIILIIIVVVLYGIVIFFVEDEDVLLKYLPGYNCNACGFGSCKGMCKAILKDKNNYKKCKPLKGEKKKKLEKYLNVEVENESINDVSNRK